MGKRSEYDLRIFNVSDGLDISVPDLIESISWKKDTNGKPRKHDRRNKDIVLMRLEPHTDRNAQAKNTYKAVSKKFNVTPERVRQIVATFCHVFEKRHKIYFDISLESDWQRSTRVKYNNWKANNER